jgi:hypothetical protein
VRYLVVSASGLGKYWTGHGCEVLGNAVARIEERPGSTEQEVNMA